MAAVELELEIYQGDPFSGACCGPGTGSPESLVKLRNLLTERSRILEQLQNAFKDRVRIKKEIVSTKRWDYPPHVRQLMAANEPLPYVFVNQKPVVIGKFPSYEEFVDLIQRGLS